MSHPSDYLRAYNGGFVAMLRWPQLDNLWQTVRNQGQAWWVYSPPATLPAAPLPAPELVPFLDQLDKRLHQEHAYDYCGIVYVDNPQSPSFIKVYDPRNLGISCGISQGKPLPGWILSHLPPEPVEPPAPVQKKFHWWHGLTGKNP